jgi:hypothetical protein
MKKERKIQDKQNEVYTIPPRKRAQVKAQPMTFIPQKQQS